MNKAYYVKYLLHGDYSPVKGIDLLAKNKYEAYDKATCELIPAREGRTPYAAWVYSVTYQNGNEKKFNTFAGKPL